jgi:hypothetical protein
MFLYEMFEGLIDTFYTVVKLLRFDCHRHLKNRWERDEVIERAVKVIEKDLDVIELVRMRQKIKALERVLFDSK